MRGYPNKHGRWVELTHCVECKEEMINVWWMKKYCSDECADLVHLRESKSAKIVKTMSYRE